MNSLIYSRAQRGSAMFMGLMILIVLSLLGVFASSSSIMQERMTGNYRDNARAFESAESGNRWIEAWFASLNDQSLQPFWCQAGTCTTTDVIWQVGQYPANSANLDQTWWNNNGAEFGINPTDGSIVAANGGVSQAPDLSETASDPRVIVEYVHCQPDTFAGCFGGTGIYFYRITSRATGGLASNVSVVESTFARRYE